MTTKEERRLPDVLHGMIVERQRLLIREATYLRGLVGLAPVRVEKWAARRTGAGHAGRAARARGGLTRASASKCNSLH